MRNRRKRACEITGMPTMPVIIRDLDDDSAAIAMVDSNLVYRERLMDLRNRVSGNFRIFLQTNPMDRVLCYVQNFIVIINAI